MSSPELLVLSLLYLDPLLLGLAPGQIAQTAVDDVLSVVGIRGERVGLILEF